jgi:hypothetical protein
VGNDLKFAPHRSFKIPVKSSQMQSSESKSFGKILTQPRVF